MNLTRCNHGHFYDMDKFESCPHCKNNGAGAAAEATVGLTGGTAGATEPYSGNAGDVTVPVGMTSPLDEVNTGLGKPIDATEEKTEAAGEASVSEPEMVFKYAELNSDDNINTRVGYEFAKYVDEMSNGRIKIEVYSASTLGDEKTCLNALQMGGGTVDMYRANTNSLSDYGFQKLNMFGLPFIFTGREGMWKVLEDEQLGRAFLTEGAEVGAGMVGLFYMDEGARNLFTTKKLLV